MDSILIPALAGSGRPAHAGKPPRTDGDHGGGEGRGERIGKPGPDGLARGLLRGLLLLRAGRYVLHHLVELRRHEEQAVQEEEAGEVE